jgi:hypothetical protein
MAASEGPLEDLIDLPVPGGQSFVPALAAQNSVPERSRDRRLIEVYPSRKDLAILMNKYRTDRADATFPVVHVNGGMYDPSNPSIEVGLNIQYAVAMALQHPLRKGRYAHQLAPLHARPEDHLTDGRHDVRRIREEHPGLRDGCATCLRSSARVGFASFS